jgi:hypothetical protein
MNRYRKNPDTARRAIPTILQPHTGKRLQVDFGKDETALVHLWQVVEKVR